MATISFTAIPAVGIIATAAPALASVHICNAFGHGYCLGAPSLNNGDPVELTTNGRDINIVDQHFTFQGSEVYRLHFAAAPTQCVGTTDLPGPVNVTIRDCSGGIDSHVNWIEVSQGDGSVKFENNTIGGALDSDNVLGDQLTMDDPCQGCYVKWVF